jgi:hypothetical protein
VADAQCASITFNRGQAGAHDLQPVVDQALAEAHAQGEFTELEHVAVKEKGHGVEPVSTLIVVSALGGAAANVLNKVWDDVLWPRIKARLGVDAVGSKRDD